MKMTLKKICYMSMFIALGVTLGFSLVTIPNIELMTATLFLSGYLLGIREGFLTGMITEAVFSLINPIGTAAPPLFLAQTMSMGLAGLIGGLCFHMRPDRLQVLYRCLSFGFAGFFITLMFAVLTNLGYILTIGFTWEKFIAGLLTGFPFIFTHILSNTIIFIIILPPVFQLAAKHRWFLLKPVQKGSS
jgi:uncharacterized membrane protein